MSKIDKLPLSSRKYLAVKCPWCGAKPFKRCFVPDMDRFIEHKIDVHNSRKEYYMDMHKKFNKK